MPRIPPNHWYVALPAANLGREPVGVRVAGRDLRLTRGPAGVEAGGAVVREAHHYVWAWHGPGAPTHEPPLPPPLARRGYAFEQRTVRIRANWRLVLENSLDFAHSAFVHPYTQPSWFLHRLGGGVMTATYGRTPTGLAVEGRFGRIPAFRHAFDLPDRLGLVVLPAVPLAVELAVWHVPEDDRTTRMEVLMGRRALPFERRGPVFKPGLLLIHEQDVAIVEAQQRARDEGPEVPEVHCAADAYVLQMRRLLDDAIAGTETPHAEAGEPRVLRMRV